MLEKVFSVYADIYNHILESFYPSLGSTGFQERNLTVNFSKAYEQVYSNNNVISWFELQFKSEKTNHLDCIIIDKAEKRIFLIEAKRYSRPDTNKQSVFRDVERIKRFSKEIKSGNERFEDYKGYKLYGLILADVWPETDGKKEILNLYKNCKMFKKNERFEEYLTIETKKYKYYLLSYIWEL